GTGVPKDVMKAAALYQKAADEGNANAENRLAILYVNGQGVPKDFVKAAFWYGKAADQGNAGAENTLGTFYQNGQGSPQNLTKAAYWYQKAADAGNQFAKQNLAAIQASQVESTPSPVARQPAATPVQRQTASANQQLSETELWRRYPPSPSGQGRVFSNAKGD